MNPQGVQVLGVSDSLHFNCRFGTAEGSVNELEYVSEYYLD